MAHKDKQETPDQEKQFQPVPVDITYADVREFMRRAGAIMQAIGDGRLPLDGSRANDAVGTHGETRYKPTIRELRAAQPTPTIVPRQLPKNTMPPRVALELIIPPGGHLDRTGLSNAANTIIRYLVVNHRATIKEMIDETELKRSTIQNALTELRHRNLVQSVKIDGVDS